MNGNLKEPSQLIPVIPMIGLKAFSARALSEHTISGPSDASPSEEGMAPRKEHSQHLHSFVRVVECIFVTFVMDCCCVVLVFKKFAAKLGEFEWRVTPGGKRISRWRKVKDSKRRDETSIHDAQWCIFWFSCRNISPRKHENEKKTAKFSAILAWRLLVNKKRSQILQTTFVSPKFAAEIWLVGSWCTKKTTALRSNAQVFGRHEAAFGLWSKCWGGDWDIHVQA